MTHIEAILQFQTHPYDLPEIPGYCALNLKLLGPPLGNSKGHPQIWKDPIAYHTFSQKWCMANLEIIAWRTGWWYTYPSEKYESQLGLLFPIYGKSNMFQTTNQRKITYVHRYNTTFLLRVSLFGKVLYLVFLQFPETDVRPLQVRWCRSFCSGSSGVWKWQTMGHTLDYIQLWQFEEKPVYHVLIQ